MSKIKTAILAATGTVGQRFASLLNDHPWFEVTVVTASEKSAGKRYTDAVNWVIPGDIPPNVANLTVQPTNDDLGDVLLVFSALPTAAAREIEPQLASAGYIVCSNASAMRMVDDVPLLVPEINYDHIGLIDAQRKNRGWDGLIVAAPNCSTTGTVFPLKILHDAFGLEQGHIVTMQAISGAGYPGVASFDILDNIMPYIGGEEEEKVETEPLKLLGTLNGGQIEFAGFTLSAQTHRVPVIDGHLAAISLKLRKKASIEQIIDAIESYQAPEAVRDLPSTPVKPVILRHEIDRPQPRRDRDAGDGMSISIGRVQPCSVFDVKLISLVHNTVRGAAGGAIHNAELLKVSGLIG
jgi:aspartate-semialdehyde dehydrogenase